MKTKSNKTLQTTSASARVWARRWPKLMKTVTLYRPVGPKELALIESSGWRQFPPRLPDQPIFYPVTNEEYAIQIARDWNVKSSGAGYVTKFEVDERFVTRYPRKVVGSGVHEELWVPTEELGAFNRHIVGFIEVTQRFEKEPEANQRVERNADSAPRNLGGSHSA